MEIAAKILIGLVAFEHLYFLYFEMFAWETLGKKAFKGAMSDEMFKATKNMASNQGLYNGFLAAGLIWSFFISEPVWAKNVAIFFLFCVIVAGIYGSISVSKKIFFVQAVPAILGLIVLCLA